MITVVTGGAGFIGTNLVGRLLEEDDIEEIRILDNFSTGSHYLFGDDRVVTFEGDLRDPDKVVAILSGAHRVIHLGALPSVPRSLDDPRSSLDVNITGTLNVLEAARECGVEHVISASSSSVYGANPILPKVESLATLPISPYAVSKLATEALTNAYTLSFGLSAIAFRFFNVFGPHQRADHAYAAVIPKFLSALKRNEPLTVFGNGEQSRDFTSVRTVVDVLAKVSIQKASVSSPVNLAFGGRLTLNGLIDKLRELHPEEIRVDYRQPRAGDVAHSQASPAKLLSLVKNIEGQSFESALGETYRWYMGQAEVRPQLSH